MAFDIDEPVAKKEWMSVAPKSERLGEFGKRGRNHVSLIDCGEDLFMCMKDNVDDGSFED